MASPRTAFLLTLSLALTVGLAAAPARAEDYPTWAEVQDAKSNEAAKRAQIEEIEALLAGLENEVAAYAKAALEAGELYHQALDALDSATATADSLEERADAAAERAEKSSLQAGALIAQLSRTGGTDFTMELMLSSADDADDLLYKIGAMSKLSEQSARVYEQAILDRNEALAVSSQAASAQAVRRQLAGEAAAALASAELASRDAEARAANQEAVAAELYAQLASLKGTSAATEQAYLDGVAWEAAQNAVVNPPAPPPPLSPTPPVNPTSPVSPAPPASPTPPAPNTDAVGGAIAFAQNQIGDAYQLNGYGPDVWDCSGLTKASYASVGVYIGTHSATNQYATMAARGRLVPYNQLVAGDLLFYSSGGSTTGTKYHVTLYVGNGLMIEAPYPGTTVRKVPVRFGDLVPYAGRPTP